MTPNDKFMGTAARYKARATVKGYSEPFVQLVWHRDAWSDGQMDGGYYPETFDIVAQPVETPKPAERFFVAEGTAEDFVSTDLEFDDLSAAEDAAEELACQTNTPQMVLKAVTYFTPSVAGAEEHRLIPKQLTHQYSLKGTGAPYVNTKEDIQHNG